MLSVLKNLAMTLSLWTWAVNDALSDISFSAVLIVLTCL